jgi:DNA-binding transcriptional MerR regulator
VEPVVFRRLKLLRRLQEVNLSPHEAQALLERVKTNRSSADDRTRLAEVIQATTEVSDQLMADAARPELAVPQRLAPERKAKRQRQLAKAARRRQRR